MRLSKISGTILGLVVVALALVSTSYFTGLVQAQEVPVAFSVDPALAQGPAGSPLAVTLNADNVDLAAGFQFNLLFDKDVVQIAPGGVVGGSFPGSVFFQANPDNVNGRLTIVVAGATALGVPHQKIADVTFDLVGAPGTFSDLTYNSVLVSDSQTQPLESTVANGRIEIDPVEVLPTLTVVKVVINDNGGTAVVSDFTLLIGDTPVTSGVANELSAGDYLVSESGPGGYAGTIGGDCDAAGNVTLAEGENKTCTITNDDVAPPTTLTVVKEVINNDGGTAVVSDFALLIDGNQVTSGVANELSADDYLVSESGPNGYAGTIGGDCDAAGNVSLVEGDAKTCVITNDDIAPTLTVNKLVINDNEGTAEVSDFTLLIDGNPVTNGVSATVSAGAHVVSESGPGGYRATFSGDCDAGGNVTLPLAVNGTCTITNNDSPPGVQIFIDPFESNVSLGSTFEIDIKVDPQGGEVAGVQAFVDFDSSILQVVDADGARPGIQIQNGTVLVDFTSLNNANNTLGQINYAAGNLAGGSPLPASVFTLATIHFEAIATTDGIPTAVTFATAPATRNTKATDLAGRNVTGDRVGGTVDVVEAVTLIVNYRLQGGARPEPQGWEQPVTVELTNVDTGETRTVDTIGQFDSINRQSFVEVPLVQLGTYHVAVTGLSTLTNIKRGVPVGLGNESVDAGILLAGNAEVVDTPNIIDIQDFGVLSGAFGLIPGDTGYDPRADFDANNVINISDFGLLVRNFLKTGPIIVS